MQGLLRELLEDSPSGVLDIIFEKLVYSLEAGCGLSCMLPVWSEGEKLRSLIAPAEVGDQRRGTSLARKRTPLGPYRRPLPRLLGGS